MALPRACCRRSERVVPRNRATDATIVFLESNRLDVTAADDAYGDTALVRAGRSPGLDRACGSPGNGSSLIAGQPVHKEAAATGRPPRLAA